MTDDETTGTPGHELDELEAPDDLEPVELEITDTLDLHTFRPQDVADVVRSYLDEAHARGLRTIRIIHGRGKGVQRRTVRTLLERDERVTAFRDAGASGGGWGATEADLE